MSAPSRTISPARRWTVLGVGVLAQTSTTAFVAAPALLIPYLHLTRGLTLAQAGLIAAAPNLGLVIALIPWGWAADRFGERGVLTIGLVATGICAGAATAASGAAALGGVFLVGGAASACANAASGRVVVGWFPKERRGLAMGIRQMCQPLGVTVAALTVPQLAAADGTGAALVLPAVLLAVSAVLVALIVVDPPRAARTVAAARNPYRAGSFLWRIHLLSALLVVPQFALSTFGLVWLVAALGWAVAPAGLLVAAAQFTGAFGRLAVGVWSDRAGSRVGPLRVVAASAVAVMVLLALTAQVAPIAAAVVFVIAATVSVADNGLAFTAVAEAAGPVWAGRALGAQNTGQFLAAALVGPVVGALIAAVGYPLAFLLVAAAPAAAMPLVPPTRAEHDRL